MRDEGTAKRTAKELRDSVQNPWLAELVQRVRAKAGINR